MLIMVVAGIAGNAIASDTLRYNPFERPDIARQPLATGLNANGHSEMKLRGTVIDGADSLVNIDGEFYRLNQTVKGYRVVRIETASVTLRSDNNEKVLTLTNDGK